MKQISGTGKRGWAWTSGAVLALFCHTATLAAVLPAQDCDALPSWSAKQFAKGVKVQWGNASYQSSRWLGANERPGVEPAWTPLGPCLPDPGVYAKPAASADGYLGARFDGAASSVRQGAIASWTWSFGDGTSATVADPALSHQYAAPGDYAVTLVVTNTLGAASKPAALTTRVTRAYREPRGDGWVYVLRRSDLRATEAALTASPTLQALRASMATLPDAEVALVAPGRAENPDNVRRVESILSAGTWRDFFRLAQNNPVLSYGNFLKAVAKFSGFCRHYPERGEADAEAICRKSMATMFAHIVRETGARNTAPTPAEAWRTGLSTLIETGCGSDGACPQYNQTCYYSANAPIEASYWPCPMDAGRVALHTYQGRGAHQITYNFNYGALSHFLFDDAAVLLNDPDRLLRDWYALASAVGYFVSTAAPKPSMLSLIDGTWQPNDKDRAHHYSAGFGFTTAIINDIECINNTAGGTRESGFSLERISYFRAFANALGVPITPQDEERLGCHTMAGVSDTAGGSADIATYWVKDWEPHLENADLHGRCTLARYLVAPVQGGGRRYLPFFATKPGDYERCVASSADVEVRE